MTGVTTATIIATASLAIGAASANRGYNAAKRAGKNARVDALAKEQAQQKKLADEKAKLDADLKAKKQHASRSRTALFETEGGIAGQELNPDQVGGNARSTLLGN